MLPQGIRRKTQIEIPPKLVPLFAPQRGEFRFRGAYGGRGSGKSFSFAKMSAIFGYREPLRILCTRELQNSIKESFHAEVKAAIESEDWLRQHYQVGESFVRGKNGTEYIFKGLRHNITAIKSMAQIDLCIIEEAEDVGEPSYIDLIPTIRAPRSEIWVIWNPRKENSPTDLRFKQSCPSRSLFVEVNFRDNPWFPDVLNTDRLDDKDRLDIETYEHIWEGKYLNNTDANVLRGKWRIDVFDPGAGWSGPYYGADWGFSTDPTALIKFWIWQKRLYVEEEKYGYQVETIDTPAMFQQIEGADKHIVRADSARPEMISHLQGHGFPKMVAAPKWAGSVEDGISWLRGFKEIVIHERCQSIAEEARLWSYKVDKQTGEVLPVLVDKYNHGWDAIRYGAAPMIRQAKGGVFVKTGQGERPKTIYKELNGQWVTDLSGSLDVWEEPSQQYVVGAVFQFSGAGISAIQVVNHHSGQQAAYWEGEVSLKQYAGLVASICRRYANAWAVVDISGQGAVVLNALRPMHKRIYSEIPPEARTGGAPKRRRFGFDGLRYLPILVGQLAADYDLGQSGIKSEKTLAEFGSFARDHENVIEVVPGCSHERVLAFCLARHGVATLPKPAGFSNVPAMDRNAGSGQTSGWGGFV